LRERAADMRDVTHRVLANLIGRKEETDLGHLSEPCVIISYDLSPSRTAVLDKKMVLGFATDIGGKTSHTAIMARSLRDSGGGGPRQREPRTPDRPACPARRLQRANHPQPTDQTLFEYGQLSRKRAGLEERLRETIDKAAVTLDGTPVALSANIENPDEIEDVKQSGADGVGLYRTEYFFINRDDLPSEEEQYQA